MARLDPGPQLHVPELSHRQAGGHETGGGLVVVARAGELGAAGDPALQAAGQIALKHLLPGQGRDVLAHQGRGHRNLEVADGVAHLLDGGEIEFGAVPRGLVARLHLGDDLAYRHGPRQQLAARVLEIDQLAPVQRRLRSGDVELTPAVHRIGARSAVARRVDRRRRLQDDLSRLVRIVGEPGPARFQEGDGAGDQRRGQGGAGLTRGAALAIGDQDQLARRHDEMVLEFVALARRRVVETGLARRVGEVGDGPIQSDGAHHQQGRIDREVPRDIRGLAHPVIAGRNHQHRIFRAARGERAVPARAEGPAGLAERSVDDAER